MCYLFWNNKEYKNRFFFVRVELKKLALKSLLSSFFFQRKKKYYWQKKYYFGKKYSITFYRNRCIINNWSRSVFRCLRCQGIKVKLFHLLVLFVGYENLLFSFFMINYHLADLVARLHVASCKFMSSVTVLYTLPNLRILVVLNLEGIIEGFKVVGGNIIVFLKYNFLNKLMLFKNTKLISTPGRRQYWKLIKLNRVFSYNNFAGFYILSTNKGIVTSYEALLKLHSGGEVLLKITI